MFPFSSEVLNGMANLTVQQSSRNMTGQSSSRNAFDSASLSGHVTPASNMFPAAAANSFVPQQLSPCRNVPPMDYGSSSDPPLSLTEEVPAAPAGSFVQEWNPNLTDSIVPGRTGSTNGFRISNNNSSVDGGQNLPRLADLSEFPSLTSRGCSNSLPRSNATIPEEQPHVSTTVAATSESTEFTIRNEDFPALPGRQLTIVSESTPNTPSVPVPRPTSPQISDQKLINHGNSSQPEQVIRAAPTDPMLRVRERIETLSVKLGLRDSRLDYDLGEFFELRLNSPDPLHPSFGGVWSKGPCGPQDVDCNVPPEYRVQSSIADMLPQVKIKKCKEEVLFHLFYTYTGDVLQIVAASELYERGWRFHIEQKAWLQQLQIAEQTATYERGAYVSYDPTKMKRVLVPQFHVEYSKLENQPIVPPAGYPYL